MKTIIALSVLGISSALSLAQDRRSSDLPSDYNVISERNMFLRDRPRPRPPSSRNTERPPEPPPERAETRFVLRGVAIEDAQLRAYFENTRGGVTQVKPGDAIASGHVLEIAIDAVAYEVDGNVTWIEVGHNLTGQRGANVASRPSSSGSSNASSSNGSASGTGNGTSSGSGSSDTSASPATAPSTPGDPGQMSAEERMRQRNRERNRR